MALMYDHNQTLVPESFLALYVRNGRPLLDRNELEARYEIAETLALHIADVAVAVPTEDLDAQREALRSVKTSLVTEPVQVSESEAAWIISRVAEICEWKLPDL
jgi:hypothetical protein